MSTVSHELRTPLTSIRAFSEILVDNPDSRRSGAAGLLETIVEETERLTRLINQVLDLSKLESGRTDWTIEPVDLRDVITTSAQASAQLFRDKDVTLDVQLPDRLPGRDAGRSISSRARPRRRRPKARLSCTVICGYSA